MELIRAVVVSTAADVASMLSKRTLLIASIVVPLLMAAKTAYGLRMAYAIAPRNALDEASKEGIISSGIFFSILWLGLALAQWMTMGRSSLLAGLATTVVAGLWTYLYVRGLFTGQPAFTEHAYFSSLVPLGLLAGSTFLLRLKNRRVPASDRT